jgi:hypothetical protein
MNNFVIQTIANINFNNKIPRLKHFKQGLIFFFLTEIWELCNS